MAGLVGQSGLFPGDRRLRELDLLGDGLPLLNRLIPWERFRPILESVPKAKPKGPGERKPYDRILLFKMMVLQQLHNLSDEQTECQIRDRLSFQRFLGISLEEAVPDHTTLWLFRESLAQAHPEFYTPASVVRTLVTTLAPYKGRIYDPCCGSGGMFVQSEKFIEAHGGRIGDISVYGEESNPNTWKLALMNLAIRGIEADLGTADADTFHKDLHPALRANYILANPPFNISDRGGDLLRDDKRWQYGIPSAGNANFAWVQHMVHHLAPYGVAGFVLANGSMSSNTSGEGEIREHLIEADLVDCMVALPGQLFYSTQIPVCLWFLAKNRDDGRGMGGKELYERTGEVLFIDARNMGFMADRTHRELSGEDIQQMADAYHNWRGDGPGEYVDIPGFCKAASLDDIRKFGHVLTPRRYVGAAAKDEDDEPFVEKMERLTQELSEQLAEGHRLEAEMRKNFRVLGYEI
ncbi:N-6 DNA methylase [Acidithiobacillus sp. M4-SHS-6]|uniref:N-6 DNA methylase n=1 Tax=Acidithiobacillus sp. M4-SHS-6 TaxID=3383024 RepID=UPI0039BE05D9